MSYTFQIRDMPDEEFSFNVSSLNACAIFEALEVSPEDGYIEWTPENLPSLRSAILKAKTSALPTRETLQVENFTYLGLESQRLHVLIEQLEQLAIIAQQEDKTLFAC